MKVKDISGFLEELAPVSLQESYDNSGLLLGDPEEKIERALISLDLTMEVLEEAIEGGYGLVITHHPLIFTGLKKLTGRSETERIVLKAIRNEIAIYAMHTNLDNVHHGVNAALCHKLGLGDTSILRPAEGILNKLVTFCPLDDADMVREALFAAGAGNIGNYDSCSYNLEGYGTFRAGEGTDPYVGEKGKLHKEVETRIEVIYPDHISGRLITALKEAHPYEEVAFDIYPLKNDHGQVGAGMLGTLEKAMSEKDFIMMLKNKLDSGMVRHSEFTGKNISRVAVCGGSGSFLIGDAMKAGADAFVTGDMKYHQFFEAEGKILLADAGHYETEQFTKELIYKAINEKFPTFALRISHINTNAVRYL